MTNGPNNPPELKSASSTGERDADRGGSADPREGRCGAKLRLSDPPTYCLRFPAKDRDRCRLHGGASPRGVESPSYKGRGYSKDIPAKLMEALAHGLEDPELTSMRHEIALLDARLGELFRTVPEESVRDAVAGVRDAAARIRYVADRPDVDRREERLSEAVADITEGLALLDVERTAWKEIYDVVTLRRRAALAETKREEALEHTMIHQQALQFFATLLTIIHEEVEDPALKKRLATKIGERMNRPALPA